LTGAQRIAFSFSPEHCSSCSRNLVVAPHPLDALPDISDVQVIIHTRWAGQPPSLIEDQVTYPIVTKLLAARTSKPCARNDARGFLCIRRV